MGVRQWFNDNARLTAVAVTVVVLAAVGFVVMQVLAARPKIQSGLPDAYFTTDDGKTFFVGNSASVPPFEYKGQQAVRAYVYECGGERFVGYLERFNPEAHKAMTSGNAGPHHHIYGRELKRPGEANWTKSGEFAAVDKLAEVKCPHGGAHAPEPVEP
jgi:hypothetical protein